MKIKKHIPNILSSSRLLSPLILIPLILSGNLLGAVVALSCFFLTDALDGFLARKWHVQSELGAKIDAVADKVILSSLLIPIVITNPIMLITLILEGVIGSINIARKVNGGNPKTVQIGRIKMIIISLFMVFCYINKLVNIPKFLFDIFFSINTLFQMITASKYLEQGIKEKSLFSKKEKNLKKVMNNYDKKEELNLEKNNEKDIVIDDYKNNLLKQKEELIELKQELLSLNNQNNKLNISKVKVKK